MVSNQFLQVYLRISPSRIHFLLFIMQGYDGLAVVTTVSARQGLVVVKFAASVQPEVFELLGNLAPSLMSETGKKYDPTKTS